MSSQVIRRTATVAAVTASLLAPLTACGGTAEDSGGEGPDGRSRSELTVLAASSLTDVFKTAARAYEKSHPDTSVRFSFAGSQELAAQVKQGAPADAVVTADTRTMDGLASDTATPRIVAKNRLVIAVRKGNPEDVAKLADLARPRLKVVLAAPQVPVGRYSRQVLAEQKTHVEPVSREPSVRAVLSKVELGEADAGIVYKTDAAAARGKVESVEIPDSENAIASYPAAALKPSQHRKAATAFVKWLASPAAQKLLRDAGFQKP